MAKEMAAGSNPQQALSNILSRFAAGGSRRRSPIDEEKKEMHDIENVEVAASDRQPRRPTSGRTAM